MIALWALQAWGGEPTGAIRVVVVGGDLDLPVPGARMRVASVEGVSDANGEVLLREVPAGVYDASASGDGLRSVIVTGVPVHVDRVTPLTICMEAGTKEPRRTEYGLSGSCERPRRHRTPAEERAVREFLQRLGPGPQRAPDKDGTRR
jgi:hypothetical protein